MAGPDGIEVGRRRTRLRPPMWLVAIVAAVALLAAVIGKLQAELAIAAAMLLVAVGDLLVARWGFAEVRGRLTFDGVAVVGEPASAVLEVHGARSRIWARVGWWQPAWFTVVPDTPGLFSVVPTHRGLLRWVDVDLVARGPLGLWQVGRRDRHHLPVALPVGPRPIPHEVEPIELFPRPFGETVLTRGADDIVRGVREYRPGDQPKLVHWPATAHRGELLVRETETLGTIRVRIALDLRDDLFGSEAAVARAAWFALDCLARGWEVELVTCERPPQPSTPLPPSTSAFALPPSCSLLDEPRSLRVGYAAGPSTTLGLAAAPPPPGATTSGDVRRPDDVARRLAVAVPGMVDLPKQTVRTRIISPEGDRWS